MAASRHQLRSKFLFAFVNSRRRQLPKVVYVRGSVESWIGSRLSQQMIFHAAETARHNCLEKQGGSRWEPENTNPGGRTERTGNEASSHEQPRTSCWGTRPHGENEKLTRPISPSNVAEILHVVLQEWDVLKACA